MLHLAVLSDEAEVAGILLRHGARVDERDYLGLTALHHAAVYGLQETAWTLLTAGADPNAAGGADGRTPLMMAVAAEHTETVQALLQYGADPDRRSAGGVVPLDLSGSLLIRDLLLIATGR